MDICDFCGVELWDDIGGNLIFGGKTYRSCDACIDLYNECMNGKHNILFFIMAKLNKIEKQIQDIEKI